MRFYGDVHANHRCQHAEGVESPLGPRPLPCRCNSHCPARISAVRCGAMTACLPWRFRWGDRFFLRRPVRDTHQLKNRYMHVDYGALEKDGTVLSASSAFPKCKSCTLNCTLGELAVLRLIADNPRITQKDLAAVIGISERTVKTRTVELQAKGLLQRVGGRRNGEWVIPSAIRGEIDAAR